MTRAGFAAIAACSAALLCAATARADDVSYASLVAPVLAGSETVIGEALTYPTGAPAKVTAVVVTVPPGGETGWHKHPVPLFGYILEGTLTVDYGAFGKRAYQAGEGLLEAMASPHNGRNTGTVPVRILAVYIGADGQANAVAAPHP